MPRRKYAWEKLSDEQLLKQRLSSLRVTVKGTWLEDCLGALYEELRARSIRLRPHAWISSEWFSPADVPGIAIPFYGRRGHFSDSNRCGSDRRQGCLPRIL